MRPRKSLEFPCQPNMVDGMYEHKFTEEEMERAIIQAGEYVARADLSHPFTEDDTLAVYRRAHLAGAAFEAFCEMYLCDGTWQAVPAWDLCEQLEPLYDVRRELDDPLSTCFEVEGTRICAMSETPGTLACPDFEEQVVDFCKHIVGADAVVRVSIDVDESWGTVYGFVDDSRVNQGRSELNAADNPKAKIDEWDENLTTGEAFPPHLEPVCHLTD